MNKPEFRNDDKIQRLPFRDWLRENKESEPKMKWHHPTVEQIRHSMRWYITHMRTAEQRGYPDGVGLGNENFAPEFSLEWNHIWGVRWSWTPGGLSGVGLKGQVHEIPEVLPPPLMTEQEREMLYHRLEGLGYGVFGYTEPSPEDLALAERLNEYGLAYRPSRDCWYLTDKGYRITHSIPAQTVLEIQAKWLHFLLLKKED